MRTFTSCLLLVLVLQLSALAETETAKHKRYPIEQFLKTTAYRGASFSPDYSKLLVSSDSTGVSNVYAISVATGDQEQLTNSTTESVYSVGYFPEDERFLYASDQGGNELTHIYLRNLDGSVVDLTPGEKVKGRFLGWSRDYKKFYLATNERDSRYFDFYEMAVSNLKPKLIFRNEQGFSFGDISADGQLLALGKSDTRDNSDIYLYDRRVEKLTLLSEHDGDINHYPSAFGPEGDSLFYTTDAGSDFRYLAKRELKTGQTTTIFQPKWDVSFAFFSEEGKYLVIGVNEDARTSLRLFEAATMREISLPEFDGLSISSFGISRNEEHVGAYLSGARSPRDLYYMSLKGDKLGDLKKLTSSLHPEIRAEDLVNGQVVRFESFDGLEVPGILYKPHGASPENKVPALVYVHGGPGGQSRVGYSALIQFIVNNGYAVYAINNRGSSGYGKKFEQLDNRNHGKNDLGDCVASKKMLIRTGFVDPDKIGIIGGSYGGYMVLAALTFRPEEFKVGVDIFGVANWHRTVQSIPPWWEAHRKSLTKELGDFDDEEYFKSISPLFHADNITKPLMVLQGANDPRVLKIESDEMVAAVRKNEVPVEYIVFDDEGHGFRKRKNQEKGYQGIVDFLDQYLRN